MSQMSPAQRFFGFAGTPGDEKSTIRVVIQGELHLMTPEGTTFPALHVRMVPGQHDDLLVAAPDLDRWGFERGDVPGYFKLQALGLSVPRCIPGLAMATADHRPSPPLPPGVHLANPVYLEPHAIRRVVVGAGSDSGIPEG